MISEQEDSTFHFPRQTTHRGELNEQVDFEDFDDDRLMPQRITSFLGPAHSLRTDSCLRTLMLAECRFVQGLSCHADSEYIRIHWFAENAE